MIEWDTHLKEPPAGIRRLEKILPDKWPVDLAAWNGPVEGKAEGGWTIFGTIGAELGGDFDATSIWSVAGDLQAALSKEQPQIFRLPRLNYRWPGRPERAGGWLKIPDRPLHPCVEGPCGALQVATVHVEKPGPWSVNVHCDDFVAVRFRGLRWKSCTGLGGIDPLDPETLFFSLGSGDGCAIGVIDLPAGDHQLEVLTGNQIFEVMTQLAAAPGVHLMEGATDQWRDPGHKAAGELAWPGVDEKGWTVNRVAHSKESPPGSLLDAFALAEDGGVETKDVPQIHFIDTGGAGDVEFPDPKPFPGDVPGQEDHFVIHATATLVIPSDGLYHIGIHAEDRCAIGIEDQTWKRIIRDTGYLAKIAGDVIMEDDTDWIGTNAQIVGEIELKKGTYTIQVLYWDHSGTSTLSVFGSPAGFAPRLITKDGAKMEPDVDGLPLLQRK